MAQRIRLSGSCTIANPSLVSRVYITEKNMETTVLHWGYIGFMENKMETTILGLGNDFGPKVCTMKVPEH